MMPVLPVLVAPVPLKKLVISDTVDKATKFHEASRLDFDVAELNAERAVLELQPMHATVCCPFVTAGARFSKAFCMNSQPVKLAVELAAPWSSASVPAMMIGPAEAMEAPPKSSVPKNI